MKGKINRFLRKGMSNIYLKVTVEKKATYPKFNLIPTMTTNALYRFLLICV